MKSQQHPSLHPTRFRRGFTIVELLVIIAVAGILLSLLLPAVQNARSTARRTQCKNNLRQHGIAIQNHISSHGFIPSGGLGAQWLGMSDRGSGRNQPGGWIYSLLPYCEQTVIFQMAPPYSSSSIATENVIEFSCRSLNLFSCPERRSAAPGPANSEFRYYGQVIPKQTAGVMTDSAKWAYYAGGNLGVNAYLGSLENCIETARQGRLVRGDRS